MAYDVLIVAGQSNAIGCGKPLSQGNNTGLFQLAQTSRGTVSEGSIVNLMEPLLGPWSDGSEGVGPGPQIARLWRARTARNVLVVPTALGGTGLVNGRWKSRRGDLYLRTVRETLEALEDGSRLIGLVWVQGEYDSLNPSVTQNDYRYWLDMFIQEFREDVNNLELPIVIGSMVPSWINSRKSGNAPAIHQVHAETPARWAYPGAPQRVAFAQGPDGSGQDQNGIHYTASMARELGNRMYNSLVSISGGYTL